MEKDYTFINRSFDKKAKARTFQVGDLVLKWDADCAKLGKNSKFDAIWSGPYMITECKGSNAFRLTKLDGEELHISINGIYLKHFY